MSGPEVSVLMYHALVEKPQPGLSPLHLPVELFEQQLAWLRAEGYAGITATALHGLLNTALETPKAVAFTFDDGYLSLLTLAAPLLQKYGFSATLFLTTGFVDHADFAAAPTFARDAPTTDRPLTWAEVSALRDLGWDIQAHSHTHRAHVGLPASELATEMQTSRTAIEQELGRTPVLYAFPYGSYSRHTLAALQPNGYAAGFSVHGGQAGPARDQRRLPRLEMNSQHSLSEFVSLVRTGYASPPEQLRATLRDALFYFPIVKDALSRLAGGASTSVHS